MTKTGVDALNTTLGVIIFAGAVNLGQSWATVATMFASLCAFYLTTWEEYHTGTLYLGLVSGPVEGVLTLCAVYALTAVKGGNYWQRPMFAELGIPTPSFMPEFLRDMPFAIWYLVYGGIILAFNIIQRYVQLYFLAIAPPAYDYTFLTPRCLYGTPLETNKRNNLTLIPL